LLELKKDGNRFQTKNLALRLYMKMIQIIRDDPESFLTNLKDIFYSISQEKDEAKRIYIIKNLLEYLFRARKDAENYTEKEIIKNIEGDYMNLLERIREEGKLEGEQKGKLEGKQENKLETARKMLEEGFTLTQISKITGLTEVQIRENGVL
jgi:predicted transposase/invertase (TIGR01784 family)